MKIILLLVGKTAAAYLSHGMDEYTKRIGHYLPFEVLIVPPAKNTGGGDQAAAKKSEAAQILKKVSDKDFLVLLDEGGKMMDSVGFAGFIQKQMNEGTRNMVFAVGGAYGFGEEVIRRADASVSMSKMTFSHQLVRLIFMEQLYRAMTILRNEPYHHG